jgi:hypothetical protein
MAKAVVGKDVETPFLFGALLPSRSTAGLRACFAGKPDESGCVFNVVIRTEHMGERRNGTETAGKNSPACDITCAVPTRFIGFSRKG